MQNSGNSAIILIVEAAREDSRQGIEPLFLSEAQNSGVRLRIGQMNKTEHEGRIQDIGRYEINIEEGSRTVTLLKQDVSYLTAPKPLLNISRPYETQTPSDQQTASAASRPNIQQEFLDKAINENQLLTIYLINGLRIKANIEAYDNFTLLLKEGGRQHLYYKHSITTINR